MNWITANFMETLEHQLKELPWQGAIVLLATLVLVVDVIDASVSVLVAKVASLLMRLSGRL
ncbi:MAG: hypothetical protein AAGU16_02910, partial [Desulfitobacterium hafniense]